MGITVEHMDESTALCLDGTIDIASSADLKTILLDVLQRRKPVRLSLATDADFDVTAIQLLWAAEREARAAGTEFRLGSQLPEAVSKALKDAGFERFPVPE